MSSYFFILSLIFSIASTDKLVISDISSIDIFLFNMFLAILTFSLEIPSLIPDI